MSAPLAFSFPLFPPSASSLAPRVDHVFFTLVGVTVLLVAALTAINLYFLIHYRRGSSAPRPPLQVNPNHVEAAWIAATTVIFLGFYFWGAHLYIFEERPPGHALEIQVTARQWMWDIRHENGRREFNELHVPLGEDVRLVMSSEDVIHSFFVPAFRLKQDIVPGKVVSSWFHATKTGTFHLFCGQYCGTAHSAMVGDVIVMPPAQYAKWLAVGNTQESVAVRGRHLFERYSCAGCHDQPAAVHAPPLGGLYGSLVPITGGGFVRADEFYIRDHILRPGRVPIVAGYENVMPSFQNVIPESDLLDLIAYIKSLPAETSGTAKPPAISPP